MSIEYTCDAEYSFGLHDTSTPGAPARIGETYDQASARLFAAAPDMLAALRWAVGMAEEAIMCRELDPEEDDTPEVIAMHREALEAARAALAKAEGRR